MKKSSCSSSALPTLMVLFALVQAAVLATAQGAGAQAGQPEAAVPSGEVDQVDRAQQFFAAGRYRESISALKAAYAAAPRPRRYYNIAVCYVKLNEPFEAITYLRLYQSEASNLSPEQQNAITAQINELRKQLTRRKEAEAAAPAQLPAAADSARVPKLRESGLTDPKQSLAQTEAADQKESVDRYDAARDLYAAGRYQEAIVELKASYALAPRPKLYFNVAMCYMKLDQPFEAIAYFQRYLGEAPEVTPERAAEIKNNITNLRTRLHATNRTPAASAHGPGSAIPHDSLQPHRHRFIGAAGSGE